MAHTCISSLLPLAVYSFAVVFYRKRKPAHDIGVTAAIAVASNAHLAVFGTHTLVNSLLATPVFWSLAVIWRILEQPDQESSLESNESSFQTESKERTMIPASTNVMSNLQTCDDVDIDASHDTVTGESTPDRLFMFLSSHVSLQLIHKCFPMPTKARMCKSSFRTNDMASQVELLNSVLLFCAGFVLMLCCYVRVDVAMFSFVTILTHVPKLTSRTIWSLFACTCGSVLALILAIAEDIFSYQSLVVSPYNWLQFNVFRDLSSTVFGRMDHSKYFSDIFLHSSITMTLSSVMLFMFISNIISMVQPVSHDIKTCWVNTLRLFASLVILLIIYSMKGHKEVRFVHNFLVLLCLQYSAVFVIFIKQIEVSSRKVFAAGLSMYVLSQFLQFPSSADSTNSFLTFESSRDSQYVIQCMDYLRQQDDVTGVFIDNHIHTSGGYTALHIEVPVISLVHFEFFQFDKYSESSLPSISFFYTKNITVKTFTETSNFITMHNTPLLLKELIVNKDYNYLVLGVNRQFIQVGYHEVFRSGTMRILKRLKGPIAEKQLSEIAKTIPIGSNATILEYEGAWLVRFNRYQKAVERLASSINLDASRVGAFQLLSHCFYKLGQETEAKKVMLKCIQLNGKPNCTTPKEGIILHEDYIMK